jgi:threonine synthase
MRYISTRGQSAPAAFIDILLGGPAPDGGLYLPETWPQLGGSLVGDFASRSYSDVAQAVMAPFIGEAFTGSEFRADVEAAYATFEHKAVAPLSEIGPNKFLLELFHGPTLAFKDIAMQLLGRLFNRALAKQKRRATVIVATSGDTGSAAIAALRGQPNVDVVVLHPHKRVSEVQRRQMTTVLDANVHNIALDGVFDDAQNIVKALFANAAFVEDTQLTAVNSINFARIMAQCVYYVTAAAALGAAQGRRAIFVVPTGNFGDVFAGEAAARMGVAMGRLVIATNANNILERALTTGVYGIGRVQPTLSPSMDIQVASNFERALFEAQNRDARATARAMADFARDKSLTIPEQALKELRGRYLAACADDSETIAAIARVYKDSGHIIDPHTAVGIAAANKLNLGLSEPVVFLSTAHPAKFPDAVLQAIGKSPKLPPNLSDLLSRKERYTVLPNAVAKVREFVLEHTRYS